MRIQTQPLGNLNGWSGNALLQDLRNKLLALLMELLSKREWPVTRGMGDSRPGDEGPLAVTLHEQTFVDQGLQGLSDCSARHAEHLDQVIL